ADGAFSAGLDARLGPLVASWGRVPDGGAGSFALDAPSPGAQNRATLPGSIVINEIHYHPKEDPADPALAGRLEFIELLNRAAEPVSLEGYRVTRGIDYALPDDAAIPAGGFLVVASDPDVLRQRAGLPPGSVVGGHASHLANG